MDTGRIRNAALARKVVPADEAAGLDGMHDVYYGTALPPNRRPVQLTWPSDRISWPTCVACRRASGHSWSSTAALLGSTGRC